MSEEMAGGSAVTPEQRKEALVERVFGSAIGFMELLSIYVGEHLGLYRALADGDAAGGSLAFFLPRSDRMVDRG